MKLNNLTTKMAEAIQTAEQIAINSKNAQCDEDHLLLACGKQEGGMVPLLLGRLQLDCNRLIEHFSQKIAKKPQTLDSAGEKPNPSQSLIELIKEAERIRVNDQDSYLSVEHVLIACLRKNSREWAELSLTEENCRKAIKELRGGRNVDQVDPEANLDALNKYAHCLNDLATKGKLDAVIGRDEEIRRIMQVLSRRNKNNPILIGEPGVGKTAIIEGLAGKIVLGEVPDSLRDRQVYTVDLGAMVAGTKYRGEFEDRFKSLLNEVRLAEGKIIIFIDEVHTLVGAGGEEGSLDASNMIKPALARGELHCIGATTLNEYQKYIEKDAAFERRFQPIYVKEPTPDEATLILRGIKNRYELHHGIRITDKAILAAVKLSHRYIRDRYLPDKAIDLLDEACSKVRIELDSLPDELDQIAKQIQALKIQCEALKMEQSEDSQKKIKEINFKIKNLDDDFLVKNDIWEKEKSEVEKLKSIREQIEQLAQEEKQYERLGDLNKVAEIRYGKLRSLEEQKVKMEESIRQKKQYYLREEITEDDIAVIVSRAIGVPVSKMMQNEKTKVLQLKDFLKKRVIAQEPALIAISSAIQRSRSGLSDPKKPVGTFLFLGPTGVGKTETAKALAEFLFDDEDVIIRVDMTEYMEKHSVARLIGSPPGYVGYEEGGQLTEAVRRRPYSLILFDEVEKAHPDVYHLFLQILDEGSLKDSKGRTVDFRNTIIIMTSNLGSELQDQINLSQAQKEQKILEATRRFFRPELLNRLDEIIIFQSLDKEALYEIIHLQLLKLFQRAQEQGIEIHLAEKQKRKFYDYILSQAYDPKYGARPINRFIQGHVATELSKAILSRSANGTTAQHFEISTDKNGLKIG